MNAALALVTADGAVAMETSAAPLPWWSVTKTLTAAAALRLAETGRLDLDKRQRGSAFTLRQLLGHRAGLPDYGCLPEYHAAVAAGEAPWPEDDLLARVGPPWFAPGRGWGYSNVGYLLVRRAIAAAHGGDFGAALAALVLAPLGVSASLAVAPGDVPGQPGYHPGWVYPGCLVGTAAEAARAVHGILAGGLLRADSRERMRRFHAVGGPDGIWLTRGYGLGLMQGTLRAGRMRAPVYVEGHGAGGPGSVGAVFHHPESGRTAAAFLVGEGDAELAALRLLSPSGI